VVNRMVFTLVLAIFLAAIGAPAHAAEPVGPRLALSVFSDGPGGEDERQEVITVGPAGEAPLSLLGGRGALIGDALSWSADGNRLAFPVSGIDSTASGDYGRGWPVVAMARFDGGGTSAYPSAFLNGGDPVMAPDGRSVAFSRLKLVKELPGHEQYIFKASIWSLDLEGSAVKRLTRWRLKGFVDPISYSPDGSSLVAESFGRGGNRIVSVDLHSGRTAPLARLPEDAEEPTYSPDGARLAFVRDKTLRRQLPTPDRPLSELWVASADGSGAKRLLSRKGYISSPSWDPSASRLAFIRDPAAEGTGALEPEPGNKVMAINADGTCLTTVYSNPKVLVSGSAWRPGPGREAGPIAC
jgi:Tol biopolymer transport system component